MYSTYPYAAQDTLIEVERLRVRSPNADDAATIATIANTAHEAGLRTNLRGLQQMLSHRARAAHLIPPPEPCVHDGVIEVWPVLYPEKGLDNEPEPELRRCPRCGLLEEGPEFIILKYTLPSEEMLANTKARAALREFHRQRFLSGEFKREALRWGVHKDEGLLTLFRRSVAVTKALSEDYPMNVALPLALQAVLMHTGAQCF